ncbi:MAG TPA: VanW family protein [Mycobacteriales bacterium]|nr:VanW family protein [Mycobacteriales bacterium]
MSVPVPPRRAVLLAGGIVVLVVALGYAAAFAAVGSGVRAGAHVGSVTIGGLSPAAAVRRLDTAYADRARAPIPVVAAERSFEIRPADAGLSLDARATVEAAGRRTLNPVPLLRATLGSDGVRPVARVDERGLSAAIAGIAEQVDREVREGAVRFDGVTPVAVAPVPGRALDRDAAAARVRAAYLRTTGPVRLPVRTVPAKVGAAEIDRALREIARPAVAAPVQLSVAGRTVSTPPAALSTPPAALSIPPAALAAHLQLVPGADGRLVPRLDGAGLRQDARVRLAAVETPPKDATYDVSTGVPRVVPSADGRTVAPNALATAVLRVLTAPAPRTATVGLTVTRPRVTTERARALGVRERVSTFTTRHPCCRPRVQNIHRIADIVDGYVVLPGETFSLNGVVGPRDRARGFVEAPMISDGDFVDSVGGGVSQFATTLFNAVFFAGLKDVEHQPHSYYISRYPAGREATVSYPWPDLKFANDSPYGVLIDTSYTGTSITVSFWSTKRYDVTSVSGPRTRFRSFGTKHESRPDCHASSGNSGFDIEVWRVFSQGGREVKRETLHTRYLPEPHVICS